MLPPLGACVAARRQVMMSAAEIGASVKRRTARVVESASKSSIAITVP